MMHAEWIKTNLWDENYFRPDKLGPKRSIYSVKWCGPLASLLFDNPSERPGWSCSQSSTYAEGFFEGLLPLVEKHGASWFLVTNPDDALSVLAWEQKAEKPRHGVRMLWSFELQPADQGGAQYLCLLFSDRDGIVVIERSQCFEIAFYGSNERWLETASALGLHDR